MREDWYELECRPYIKGCLAESAEYVERDNNHGFAVGDGTPGEKAAAWARDLTWDWCHRTEHEPGKWRVTLWRLDDRGSRRLRQLAQETVYWPRSQQPKNHFND